jgi:hypothetical protein
MRHVHVKHYEDHGLKVSSYLIADPAHAPRALHASVPMLGIEVRLQMVFYDEYMVKGLIEASSVGFASSVVVL